MKYTYKYKRQVEDLRDFKFIPIHTVETLPKSVDLRNIMPKKVYHQGRIASCTANSIGCIVHTLSNFMPSRLFIYYNERVVENTINKDIGADIRTGIKTINKLGVCSEDLWIYDVRKYKVKPSDACYESALLHQSLIYNAVPQDELSIKSALASGFPIAFAFDVKESFKSKKMYNTGIYEPNENEETVDSHAVTIVGYKDDKFIIRNSWGNRWGQKGYFTMPIKDVINETISYDFWIIKKME